MRRPESDGLVGDELIVGRMTSWKLSFRLALPKLAGILPNPIEYRFLPTLTLTRLFSLMDVSLFLISFLSLLTSCRFLLSRFPG